MDIEQAIENAKTPGPLYCRECDEELYSPMAKLSLALHGKCEIHLEDHQEKNLLKVSELL